MKRKPVAHNGYTFTGIAGETIAEMKYNVPEGWDYNKPQNIYSAFTITMKSGRVFVITQCMGEMQIDEVLP
jgi:hypothetical protein